MRKFIIKHYRSLTLIAFLMQWASALAAVIFYFINGWWCLWAFLLCLVSHFLTVRFAGVVKDQYLQNIWVKPLRGLFGKPKRRKKRKIIRKYGKPIDLDK